MRNMLMSDPVKFEMIKQRFPELADAIQKNDTPKMLQLISQVSSGLGGENFLQTPVIANDFDMEAQKRIEEFSAPQIQPDLYPEPIILAILIYI